MVGKGDTGEAFPVDMGRTNRSVFRLACTRDARILGGEGSPQDTDFAYFGEMVARSAQGALTSKRNDLQAFTPLGFTRLRPSAPVAASKGQRLAEARPASAFFMPREVVNVGTFPTPSYACLR